MRNQAIGHIPTNLLGISTHRISVATPTTSADNDHLAQSRPMDGSFAKIGFAQATPLGVAESGAAGQAASRTPGREAMAILAPSNDDRLRMRDLEGVFDAEAATVLSRTLRIRAQREPMYQHRRLGLQNLHWHIAQRRGRKIGATDAIEAQPAARAPFNGVRNDDPSISVVICKRN
jgi:hypothetical protein